MEYIIERILEILKNNNISVYSFAKTTGISRSSLHMILHFERTMKPKYFYTIIDNLPVSIDEKKDLTERFQKISMGDIRYSANSYIFDMLKDFSEYTYMPISKKFIAPPRKF